MSYMMYLCNKQLFYVTFVFLRYHLTCGLRYNTKVLLIGFHEIATTGNHFRSLLKPQGELIASDGQRWPRADQVAKPPLGLP